MRKRLVCSVSLLVLLTACAKPGAPTREESAGLAAPAEYPAPMVENNEKYDGKDVSNVVRVAEAPVSTFAVDVDTGAYANARRMLTQGQRPPAAAVRTEELVNYLRYDNPLPADRSKPFSITTDVSTTPWNPKSRLLRIGLRAYDVPRAERPAANLVFLIDVSGSMDEPDKLPLVKSALRMVADHMRSDDKVSIVVYAGAAGLVLSPTSNPAEVRQALDQLQAGGSTAGGEGIALAYDTARASFIKGGINRVILATDGDFNVGISDTKDVEALVKQNKDDGITLTTLGFGEGNYNDAMMEHIADVGNGNYAYIDSSAEARKVLDEELSSTLFTVAQDVKMQVEFNPSQVSQYRLIGYEDRALAEEDFNNDAVDAGDIGAGHQVTALYEIVPAGETGWLPDRHFNANNKSLVATNGNANDLVWLKLRYKLPGGKESQLIEQAIPASAVTQAKAPTGDLAFVEGVAAYGQILRGDKYLGRFSLADARQLVGHPNDDRRQEFVELTKLAELARAAE
ncbi:MAG TPA: VWA domain-containing protein [Asticcacaulis sp.]|nr:VWA domain-containing protein [Asticcacaulis sp.]